LTTTFWLTILIGVNFHPIVANQPDQFLQGQKFIKLKLALQDFGLFDLNTSGATSPLNWPPGHDIDQRK